MLAFDQKSHPLPNTPSLRASVLMPLMRYFADQPKHFAMLCQRRGIRPSDIADPYAPVKLSSYLQVFEDAALFVNKPLLGIEIAQKIKPADLGPIGLLMLQSDSIFNGLKRFSAGLSALQTATEISLSDYSSYNNLLAVNYSFSDRVLHGKFVQDCEFSCASLCNLIRVGFNNNWHPTAVHFEHSRTDRKEALEAFFKAPVYFGRSCNRLIMDQESAYTTYRAEDKLMISMMKHHISDLMTESHQTLLDQVRAILDQDVGHKPITLHRVANELGLSQRSLQRKLAEHNTSFRMEVQAMRTRVADACLSDQSSTMSSVASTLGYSGPAVFWRAYKNWTGKSPSSAKYT